MLSNFRRVEDGEKLCKDLILLVQVTSHLLTILYPFDKSRKLQMEAVHNKSVLICTQLNNEEGIKTNVSLVEFQCSTFRSVPTLRRNMQSS